MATTERVLVPVAVLEGQTVDESVVEFLSSIPVVVLGYHVLPEQTPPGQARLQFEDQAQARLDELAERFRTGETPAETRLVFTNDERQTVERVAEETDCTAVLVANPAAAVTRLLVAVDGGTDPGRLTAFVAALRGDRDIDLTLYHVAESEADREAGRDLLADAARRLEEAGVPAAALTETVAVSGSRVEELAAAAADHDAVAMGESGPSLRDVVFGDLAERVAARSLGPVVVVRQQEDA